MSWIYMSYIWDVREGTESERYTPMVRHRWVCYKI